MFSRACLIVFMLVINGPVSFYESLLPCGLVTVGTMWNFCLTVTQRQHEPQLWTPRRFLLQLTYDGREQIGLRINIKSYAESQWGKQISIAPVQNRGWGGGGELNLSPCGKN